MAFSLPTTLPLLLLLLLFTISVSARPCKTIFFFSTSSTTSPQNPTSTPHLITFYLTTPNPNPTNTNTNTPNRFFLIPHTRHTRLTFDNIGVENQEQPHHPHPHHLHHHDHDHHLHGPMVKPEGRRSSIKERTMDIMSVVGALLFGMGCGALTAATMYLVWSLFAANRFEDEDEEEEVEEVEFDEDLYNTKKIAQNGYVAVSNKVVEDDQVVGKEGE